MGDTKSVEELLEQCIDKTTEKVKGLLTEREQADAERSAALSTEIDELRSQLKQYEERQEDLRATSLPGVEYDEKGSKPGKAFSLARAIQLARASAKGLKLDEREYGYEIEVQRSLEDQKTERTYNIGTDGAGGVFVPHEVMVDSIVPLLTDRAVVRQAGARVIGGLRGDLSWPVAEGGTTTYYVDTEGEEAITESTETFGTLSARPRTLAAMQKMTHKMLLQPALAIEGFIRDAFAREFALREDLSAIEGLGAAGEPLGLVNVDGINTSNSIDVSADNGGASGTIVDELTAFVYEPSIQKYTNPAGRWSWLMTPDVAKLAASMKDADGRRLFQDTNSAMLTSLLGYPVFTSTQFNSGAQFACWGDFTQLLILNWGGLTIRATEEGDDAKRLRMSVIGYMDHDMLVVQPKAFSVDTSVTIA